MLVELIPREDVVVACPLPAGRSYLMFLLATSLLMLGSVGNLLPTSNSKQHMLLVGL